MSAKVLPLRRPAVPGVGQRWLSWVALDELNHAAALAAAQDDSPLTGEEAEDVRAIAAFVETLNKNRGSTR
jgi:hypothetical protein